MKQKNPFKSASELRLELQKYIDDLGTQGRDSLYGHGFINYLAYDQTPPANITALQATAKTPNSITVSWANPTDADFVKAVVYVNGEINGETDLETYHIPNLSPSTDYTIVVKSVDQNDNESFGTSVIVKTEAEQDTTAPAEVTEAQATKITTTSAVITWVNPSNDDFTNVNIYTHGEKVHSVSKGEEATFTMNGLTEETSYDVTLKTVDQAANESSGISVRFTTEKETTAVNPNPQPDPLEQEEPIDPAVPAPAPSGPIDMIGAPATAHPDINGEIHVTKEMWVEKDQTVELVVSTVLTKGVKIIFFPDIWNQLKLLKKDLSFTFDSAKIALPEETISEMKIINETLLAVGFEKSPPKQGIGFLTKVLKIEIIDQVTQEKIKAFKKPISIAINMESAPVIANKKATFGALYNENLQQWQFAGGKKTGDQWVIEAKQAASYAVMESSKTFTDIQSHWAKPEIEHLASRLIIQGKTADLFSPNEEVTRSQFVVLLARMLSLPTSKLTGTFKDITASQSWSAAYIEAAYRYGITAGFGDSTFRPNQVITRQEMAAMIVRALKVEKPAALVGTTKSLIFIDDKHLSTTFKEEIYLAASTGLIKGRGNGSFDPLAKATRAETSVVLYRALNK